MKKILLYGSNGYTARLMLDLLDKYQLSPILAGRRQSAIEPLAEQYKLDCRVFNLDRHETIVDHLQGIDLVLHCAGPFSKTAEPMLKACIAAKAHYLDITGEIEVFELCKRHDEQAKQSGIVVMPGVGFDVVPSDTAAFLAAQKIQDPSKLTLYFGVRGGTMSPGTTLTMAENLGKGGAARVNGKIKIESVAAEKARIRLFPDEAFSMGSIPWGDVSTAYTSTRIPNIRVLTTMPESQSKQANKLKGFGGILRSRPVQWIMSKYIRARVKGPNQAQRDKARSAIIAHVQNDQGQSAAIRIETIEGYNLTAHTALSCAKHVLVQDLPAGYHTPTTAFGDSIMREIHETTIHEIQFADVVE